MDAFEYGKKAGIEARKGKQGFWVALLQTLRKFWDKEMTHPEKEASDETNS